MKSDAPHSTRRESKPDFHAPPQGEALSSLLWDGLPGMAYRAHIDRERTIEFASAGCQALLGVKPDQKPIRLGPLIHPDDRERVLEVVRSAVAKNGPFAMEYRLHHAAGDWRTVWEQGQPMHHGSQLAVQGLLLDITQRLQGEEARLAAKAGLLQAQKFQALNQLASGLAHEFNNLIAGILGSAELISMDMPEGHPSRETLKQIFEASNQAREFVHKLRTLGQRLPPEFKPVRLQLIIEESLQILRTIIPAKVELVAEARPDCPMVNADSAQILQAILDLCLHAWQGLADRRGRITIRLESCPVAHPPAGPANLLPPGRHVWLRVQDNSPGLEKNVCEHIFHPFRNRRAGGTKVGLELFLVREIIQAHLGEIFVDSEPGRGLTFHIYLPVAGE